MAAGTDISGQLAIGNGGTGQSTKAAAFDALSPLTTVGDLLYGGASGTGTRLGSGRTGQILTTNTGAAPAWTTATFPSTTTANQLLYSSATNTVGGLSSTATGALVTNSSSVPSFASGTTANRVLRTDGTSVTFSQVAAATDVSGQLGISNGGTGQSTKAPAFDALSPMTTVGDIIYGGTSGTGTRLANGTTGQVLTATTGSAPSWQTPSAQYMFVQDQKTSGTQGGSSSSGVNIRVLNTVVVNTISGASLASNQVTLPAGTYRIAAVAPAVRPNNERLYVYNTSTSATVLLGTSLRSSSADTEGFNTTVSGQITLGSTGVLELRHYIAGAFATLGLGDAVSDGQTEVYASMEITKIN